MLEVQALNAIWIEQKYSSLDQSIQLWRGFVWAGDADTILTLTPERYGASICGIYGRYVVKDN